MTARERSPLRVHVTYEPDGWYRWVVRCPGCNSTYSAFPDQVSAVVAANFHAADCGHLRARWFADAVRLAALVAELDKLAVDCTLIATQDWRALIQRNAYSDVGWFVRALADRYRPGSAS